MSLLWKHGYVVPPITLYVAPCPTESGDTVNSFICCLHAVTSFSFQRVFHAHQIYKWLFLIWFSWHENCSPSYAYIVTTVRKWMHCKNKNWALWDCHEKYAAPPFYSKAKLQRTEPGSFTQNTTQGTYVAESHAICWKLSTQKCFKLTLMWNLRYLKGDFKDYDCCPQKLDNAHPLGWVNEETDIECIISLLRNNVEM